MIYDELAERLRNCATQAAPCKTCDMTEDGSCSDTLMKQAADAIKELSKLNAEITRRELKLRMEKPRWIPVTERLPDFEGCLLCMRKAFVGDNLCYQDILYYDEDGFRMEFEDTPIPTEAVTHWTPLPMPPNEEKIS